MLTSYRLYCRTTFNLFTYKSLMYQLFNFVGRGLRADVLPFHGTRSEIVWVPVVHGPVNRCEYRESVSKWNKW